MSSAFLQTSVIPLGEVHLHIGDLFHLLFVLCHTFIPLHLYYEHLSHFSPSPYCIHSGEKCQPSPSSQGPEIHARGQAPSQSASSSVAAPISAAPRRDRGVHGSPRSVQARTSVINDAQLVHRHHPGGLPQLQGPVVAKPGRAGGKPRQDQKQPAAAADLPQAALGMGEEHHPPGHRQYHHRSDGRRQVGRDPLYAYLRQNRCQRSKHRRPQRQYEPHRNAPFQDTIIIPPIVPCCNPIRGPPALSPPDRWVLPFLCFALVFCSCP